MSKEYIEREVLLQKLQKVADRSGMGAAIASIIIQLVQSLPAADVSPIRKSTEEEKTKFKSLFAKKEKYYKLSTIYDLAFEDDINSTCDGNVDAWLIATLTSADVVPVVHGEWIDKCVRDWHCSLCDCAIQKIRKVDGYCYDDLPNYCPDCGAKMDGGK